MVISEAASRYAQYSTVSEIPVATSVLETPTEPKCPDKTIVVQMAKPDWTHRALAQACPMSIAMNAEIVLLDLIPVQHLGWLGTDLGWSQQSDAYDHYEEYIEAVRLYGVPVSIQPFQYSSLSEALVQASENLEANTVFATLPVGFSPFLHQLRMGQLQRRLTNQGCQFVTLP